MLNYIKLIRVPQWIKNFFVFVPLIFSQHIFNKTYFLPALSAFFLFCLVSSIVYIINDIVDIEADRSHPTKKNRPLTAGINFNSKCRDYYYCFCSFAWFIFAGS